MILEYVFFWKELLLHVTIVKKKLTLIKHVGKITEGIYIVTMEGILEWQFIKSWREEKNNGRHTFSEKVRAWGPLRKGTEINNGRVKLSFD